MVKRYHQNQNNRKVQTVVYHRFFLDQNNHVEKNKTTMRERNPANIKGHFQQDRQIGT